MKRYLFVLDLNGTIVDSTHKKRAGVPHDTKVRFKFVYFRPHMKQFLDFLLDNFSVAIWTSNAQENAVESAHQIFGDRASELEFVWSRDHCVTFDRHEQYRSEKRLDKLWESFDGKYNPLNTFIVDDSPEKIVGSGREHSYLQIATFQATPMTLILDKELKRFRTILDQELLQEKSLHYERLCSRLQSKQSCR